MLSSSRAHEIDVYIELQSSAVELTEAMRREDGRQQGNRDGYAALGRRKPVTRASTKYRRSMLAGVVLAVRGTGSGNSRP